MNGDDIAVFDALYRADADPWRTQTRWYEKRKRELLLSSLPDERYGAVYEAGCGTGHLTLRLAERCDELLASDASAEAVALTRTAVGARTHVRIEQQRLPDAWPEGRFDLIVLGELLYFTGEAARVRIAAAARDAAAVSGLVVACDWRHVIEGRSITGEDAHRHFERCLALPRAYEYADDDFILTGWCGDTRSVAQRAAIR